MTAPFFVWTVLVLAAVGAVAWVVHFPSMRNFVDLSVGVAIPVTVLVGLCMFRSEIAERIKNLKKVSRDGAEFDQPQGPLKIEPTLPSLPAPVNSVQVQAANADAGKAPIENIIGPAFRPLFERTLEATRARLSPARAVLSGSDFDVALAWAAEAISAVQLERVSRYIFESQLIALDDLKFGKTTKGAFRPHYDKAVAANPANYANYSFDEWFNFLVQRELIAGTDDQLEVTALGEAISTYMGTLKYRPLPG
jgi:hypothetical protein